MLMIHTKTLQINKIKGLILLEDKFYTIKEAATFLETSVRTIQRLRQDGSITPDKFGDNHTVFYSESQLQKFKFKKSKSKRSNTSNHNLSKSNTNSKKSVTVKNVSNIKSISFAPVSKRKDPNDKIAKNLFNMTDNQQEAGKLVVLEGEIKHKGRNGYTEVEQITTPINLEYSRYLKQFLDEDNPIFTPFDRDVLYGCIAIQNAGNKFTTVDTIYRTITGDSAKRRPHEPMIELIRQSLNKLLFCDIEIDLSDVCQKWGYNGGKAVTLFSAILPGRYVKTVINGETAIIVEFYEPSPLLMASEIKNGQILTYDKTLLDIPIRNTPDIIVVKNYLLRRVLEIILHNLNPIITFDDIFEKNGMTDYSIVQKQGIRDNIKDMFEFWITKKVINEYVINKYQNIPYSITISYKKSETSFSLI